MTDEQAEAGAVERVTRWINRDKTVPMYDGHLHIDDLRTLLADMARMKAALEKIGAVEPLGGQHSDEGYALTQNWMIKTARLALRQHEDGK